MQKIRSQDFNQVSLSISPVQRATVIGLISSTQQMESMANEPFSLQKRGQCLELSKYPTVCIKRRTERSRKTEENYISYVFMTGGVTAFSIKDIHQQTKLYNQTLFLLYLYHRRSILQNLKSMFEHIYFRTFWVDSALSIHPPIWLERSIILEKILQFRTYF